MSMQINFLVRASDALIGKSIYLDMEFLNRLFLIALKCYEKFVKIRSERPMYSLCTISQVLVSALIGALRKC